MNNNDKGSTINDLKLSRTTSQKIKLHLKNQMLCQGIQRTKLRRFSKENFWKELKEN